MRFLFLLIVLPFALQAQQKNCINSVLEKKLQDVVRTYLDDDYEINTVDYFQALPQQKIEFKKNLNSDFEYVVLLITPQGASFAEIQLLNRNKIEQEKEQSTLLLDSDFIELEFEPYYDDMYLIRCSVQYKQQFNFCAAMVLLERESEDNTKRRK